MPHFLSSIADKAQNALNASPLAAHLPGRSNSPDIAGQPSANTAATVSDGGGGYRSYALDAIQYQIRAFGQQYTTTTPLQRIITIEKGVAIGFDGLSRDSKTQSKELFNWGQLEQEDIKDVTDRIAFLNFVYGSLASDVAVKLNAARVPLKAVRDAEAALAPRRNILSGLQLQLSRIEHDQQQGMEKRIAELKEQIKRAEAEDAPKEKEVELLKRRGLRESESVKWDALRELGEKLVLLSQAAKPIISALPTIPPSQAHPYTGAQATAAARASVQHALDNYTVGNVYLPPAQHTPHDLSRSDTRSFGESHASELSLDHPVAGVGIPITPPMTTSPLPASPHPAQSVPGKTQTTTPIDPHTLNQSPAQLPNPVVAVASPVAPDDTTTVPPPIIPTVAETGVPVSAGPQGPGPATGSLHDIRGVSSAADTGSATRPAGAQSGPGSLAAVASAPKYETAEEEKKRLQREERERVLTVPSSGTAPPPAAVAPAPAAAPSNETAEEEKKRLEREERERVLHAEAGVKKSDDDLPPYPDF